MTDCDGCTVEKDKRLVTLEAENARLRERMLWPPGGRDWTVIRSSELDRLTTQLAEANAAVEHLQMLYAHETKQNQSLQNELSEWHKVFGHLSTDPDTAGNTINEGIAERDAGIERLKAELAHWKANHEDLKRRLQFLNQRTDLPVDRIPVYEVMKAENDANTKNTAN